jgi:hypothetical protein
MIHSRIDAGDAEGPARRVVLHAGGPGERGAAALARGAATAPRTLIDTDASNYGVLPPSEDYLPLG